MREILFIAKRKDNGEWVQGYYVETLRYNKLHWIWDGKEYVKVDPKTVGQYTGLTDKNGKKIFEGHIIKKGFEVFVVKWNAEQCRFDLYTDKNNIQCGFNVFSQKYFEIIGNITDNPELLGDKLWNAQNICNYAN